MTYVLYHTPLRKLYEFKVFIIKYKADCAIDCGTVAKEFKQAKTRLVKTEEGDRQEVRSPHFVSQVSTLIDRKS
jgi:hypothetical protein